MAQCLPQILTNKEKATAVDFEDFFGCTVLDVPESRGMTEEADW